MRFDEMSTIIGSIRRVLGFPKYVTIPYDWIVSRDGRDIAHLHDALWTDMFWRSPILTPIGPLPSTNLFDDAYWADCNYQVRHAVLHLTAPHVIIRAFGKPPRVSVRGIPERLPEHELPAERDVEPGNRGLDPSNPHTT